MARHGGGSSTRRAHGRREELRVGFLGFVSFGCLEDRVLSNGVN